ncbi:acyl-CoA dehydrogenase [Streptomyces capparidis]
MAMIGAEAAGVLGTTGAPPARATAAERAAALETLLGDPADPANPLGHEALLAADARAEPPGDGERLLDRFALNAEFVPAHLGGRLDSVEGLARVLRPLFRRDAALGLGYGVTTFLAAVTSWLAGSPEQQRRTAGLLLGGGRMAVAHLALAHGNDFARDEFRAVPDGRGLRVSGRNRVMANVERAEALTVYARIAPEPGSHSHSVLLLDRDRIPPAHLTPLPRRRTHGARGVRFAGLRLSGLPVPRSAVVGQTGEGVALALRSFQVTRGAVPSMALGLVDTCLRLAVRFAEERGGSAGAGADSRNARPVFAAALADLLLSDSLCLAATRAASLLPEQTGVPAAAVEYLVPKILGEAVHDLSVVLGSAVYERRGPYGVFAKHVRDLPVTGLGHTGAAACQATIIPQLPLLAARAWFDGEPAPRALFGIGGPLPALRLAGLRPAAGRDALAATLVEVAESGPPRGGGAGEAAVQRLAQGFARELRALRGRIGVAGPAGAAGIAPAAVPELTAVADRYAHVLAAAACLGVWRREADARPGGFLADPAWVVTALARAAGRLGGLPGVADPAEVAAPYEDRLADEVMARYRDGLGYDLYGARVSG